MMKLPMLIAYLVLWMLTSNVEGQEEGDFWWLKATTNGPPEPTVTPSDQPPCECVKYYLCVNGTISTSGVGLIDVRIRPQNRPPPRNRDLISVTQCPDLYDVCCTPPPPLTPKTTTTSEPTLPSDTPCECISFVNCTAERLVSDGGGNTSIEAYGFTYSHSSCPNAFTVCCALEPTTTHLPREPIITTPPTHIPAHCDCVDSYLCDATGTIITSGVGLIDVRNRHSNPNPNVECENPQQVCCNKPLPETSFSNTTTTTTTTQTPITLSTTSPNCGSRNIMGITARIIGFKDGESQFGEFPWVTAVLRQEVLVNKTINLFVGGGTLVHSKVVITAAHKIIGLRSNKLWVRLGEWDTQTQYEAFAHKDIQVEEIVIHPNFDPAALYNDLALLFLKEEAPNAPHINHICIAEDLKEVNTDACVINGWGKNGFEEDGEYQKIMKSLTLPLVNQETCQDQLRTTRLGKYFRLHHSFLCAGGELGKDACTGDGGGPLACPRINDTTRYLLVGITAWGIGCGQDGIPGVYASTPASFNWIKSEIHSRYPPPASTTITTTTKTTTTIRPFPATETADYDYDSWEDMRSNKRNERERRKQRRQQRQRERHERQRPEKEEIKETRENKRHMRRQERERIREERQRRREERRHRYDEYE